ncbi:MAG: TIGR03663 family protein [Anaerolineae bacterium]
MEQTVPQPKRGTAGEHTASLDTPVQSLVRLNWETVTYAVFFVLAVITRFWQLGQRAMSHDESLHALYSWNLYAGKGYEHNPMMHGPFRFHMDALAYFLFGVNDFVVRLPAAVFGIATVILIPILLRPYLGRVGALVTSGLLLISPVVLYYQRYIRDEVFVGFFALLIIVAIFRWLDTRRAGWLYVIATAMVFMITSMESGFIQIALMGVFLTVALILQLTDRRAARAAAGKGQSAPTPSFLERLRDHPLTALVVIMGTLPIPFGAAILIRAAGRNPQDYTAPNVYFSMAVVLALLAVAAAIGIWWDWRRWLVAAAIFFSISLLLYTTFFTNRQGVFTGYIGSLGYWLDQHGVERGSQPWYYYGFLAPIYEYLPLWFGIAAMIYYPFRVAKMTARGGSSLSRSLFVPFAIWWALGSFVAFSVAGERMPWLLYYIAVPLILLAGRFVGDIFEDTDWRTIGANRGLLFAVLLVPTIIILMIWLILRPFQGQDITAVQQTTLWIGGLVVLAALVWGLYSVGRRLGRSGMGRVTFATVFGLGVLLTIRTSWTANFVNDELATEFIVYAHATPDVKMVANELDNLSAQLGGPKEMKIVYDNLVPWPFEWYLKDYPNKQYVGETPPGPIDAPVVLVGEANDAKFKPYLRNDYVRREYNMIWWPMEDYKNQTPASILAILQNPAERQKWFDILMWRKYPKPLSDWYHHNKFILYVKKDVVNKIWPYQAADPALAAAGTTTTTSALDKVQKDVTAQATFGGAGQLANPRGVAVDDKGNVFVVDTNNNRIVKYGPNGGQPLKTFGGPGSQPGQFKDGPWGIAVDPQRGFVYVADTWNHRIQKFTTDGDFVSLWGVFDQAASPTDKPLAFYGPRAIAIDKDGNLYVTDTGNKRVSKFDPDGKPLAQYGGGGFDPGQFQEPVGIAISPVDGSIYVADTWNRRVQKFDKDMRPVAQWPVEAWDGQGVNNKPYLAVDAKNRVYLTDPEGFRVIVLDDKGAPVAVMGLPGKDNKGVDLPTGIALGKDGKIFIADTNNNRIVQWPALP